jgi:hypothetical protein
VDSKTFQPQQSYKNRADAYRRFIQAQELPVSQTKFYNDADRLNLVKQDKSIDLASLLAYVRQELKIEPSTGRSLVQQSRAQEMEELEWRKLKAETERRERENEESARSLDKKWLHRDTAEEALAALVGVLQGALDHQIYVGVPGLIHVAGGDPAHLDEVTESICAMVSTAFSEVLAADKIEGVFVIGEMEDDGL